ncbi:heterokaryon incompatibility protein-domain-containing protein [Leptodontidium sp. MPI-SDFR-AT-0119]|nr:heterokaryon incompatibility protein-domain-containing protein [Leptodontidium sp. MPI-SDFR-AT-0119]
MSKYNHDYDILRHDPLEFRLVTIHAGALPSPITASLSTHPLKDAPPYEALSYVWGPFDEKDPDLILLNDYGFVVTTNLSRAMYSLRKEDTDRILWIDAISIDQDDLDERSSQVQLMRDIYRAASGTVVWLGEELLYTDRTFDLLKSLSAGWGGSSDASHEVVQQRVSELHRVLLTDEKFRKVVQRGVYGDMGQRDFWTRIWVVQEVALSSNVTIVCGSNEMDWQEFSDTIWNLDEASNMAMATPENELDIGGLSNIDTFSIMRELLRDAVNLRLSDIVALLRRSRSTDPRDMIYGLLGLVPRCSIRVDYSNASTKYVYLDLVHRCIVEEESLDIVTLCRKTSSNLELPSWVPDWTDPWVLGYGEDYKAMTNPDPPSYPLILKYGSGALLKNFISNTSSGLDSTLQFEAWSADASSAPRASIDKTLSTLTAGGVPIGSISQLGDWTFRGDDEGEIFFFDIMSSWENLMIQRFDMCQDTNSGRTILDVFDRLLDIMIGHLGDSAVDIVKEKEDKIQRRLVQKRDRKARYQETFATYVAGGSIVEAFIRTVVVDTDASFQRLSPAKYEAFWDADVTGSLAWGLEIYALTFATNRRFFITGNGYIGLAPIRANIGDKLCVLYGCSVPLVLREEHGVVGLVGEAYVHGLMRGEAVALVQKGTWKGRQWVFR